MPTPRLLMFVTRARLIGTRTGGDNAERLLALRVACAASLRDDGHPFPSNKAA